MEEYLKKRPSKKVFQSAVVASLRTLAINKIKSKLLPDDKIIKIILIGSSIKGSFGKYDPPGFRGSLFSDFDFIVFAENDYKIPQWLDIEPDGKPFTDDKMNLAYRNKRFIENKYDIEVSFLRRNNFKNPVIQEQGELVGIPMTSNTAHKYLLVYEKNDRASYTMDDITISMMKDEEEIDILHGKSSFNYTYDEATIDLLKKHFALKDSLYLVARKDSEFVAFCSIDRDWWEENFFFIREILVDPIFQKLGVGSQLMSRCIEYAKSKGASGVVTETAFENSPMQILCERLGFTKWKNPRWKEGLTYKLLFQ